MQKRHMLYVCNKKKKLCTKSQNEMGSSRIKTNRREAQVEDMEFPGVLKEYPHDV